MKLEEIIATKLKCLMQRQHAPDLYDYVHSIKLLGGNLNKEEVVQTFIQKTIFHRNPFVLKEILYKTPFNYHREYWDKTLVCAKQFLIGAEEAIQVFTSGLEDLFSIYPDNGYAQFVYFKADLRIPILEAGRTQTLLKIRYDGVDRIIEPYALKYMQKKNGEAREYFYVYNQMGGKNEPGIRCFVPEKIQSIENTEEKFVPRAIIELSKSGEMPENRYLFDPNKPTPSPKRLRAKIRGGIRYVYKCSSCGKASIKTKMDGKLKAHKNKSGYPCGGRYGYYVGTRY